MAEEKKDCYYVDAVVLTTVKVFFDNPVTKTKAKELLKGKDLDDVNELWDYYCEDFYVKDVEHVA